MAFQYYKHLRSFYAVAKTGGFTSAAAYLNIGQPTVTEQVQDLEERFRVELFYRRGRRTELSPAGKELYSLACGMFAYEDEALQLLTDFRDARSARVRIGATSPALGVLFVEKIRQADPTKRIDLSFPSESEIHDLVENFELDLGIAPCLDNDSRFATTLHQRTTITAVAHREHAWAARLNLTLRDLSVDTSLYVQDDSSVARQLEQVCHDHSLPPPAFRKVTSIQALLHLVLDGKGIAFISNADFIAEPRLVTIPLAHGTVYVDYHLIHLETRVDRPSIRSIRSLSG